MLCALEKDFVDLFCTLYNMLKVTTNDSHQFATDRLIYVVITNVKMTSFNDCVVRNGGATGPNKQT